MAKPRVPSEKEKKKAHKKVQELVDAPLPEPFYFQSVGPPEYEMYAEKLLPDTWKLLREARLAGVDRGWKRHGLMREPAGLSVMSILADCCAGTTRARITDRGAAYATIAKLLQSPDADDHRENEPTARQQFVAITLNLIDSSAMDLARLIDFRKRESKSGGHSYRDLRHRYVDRMEAYVKQVTTLEGTASDAKVLARELMDDMNDDLAVLADELGFARNEILFSKDVITAAVAGIGTIAASIFGLPMVVEGVVTAVGAPVTIGGILGSRSKYRFLRSSVLHKHPMAYLYELRRS